MPRPNRPDTPQVLASTNGLLAFSTYTSMYYVYEYNTENVDAAAFVYTGYVRKVASVSMLLRNHMSRHVSNLL